MDPETISKLILKAKGKWRDLEQLMWFRANQKVINDIQSYLAYCANRLLEFNQVQGPLYPLKLNKLKGQGKDLNSASEEIRDFMTETMDYWLG